MKIVRNIVLLIGFVVTMNLSMAQVSKDSELYITLKAMDSTYFTAYNTCDMKTQAGIMAEDIEFYHDQGGLATSKQEILESIESNICNKVTRELVEGSFEVHEIKGYGAVAMGLHKFHNNQEPDAISKPSKFIGIWTQQNDKWQMSRVISLH